MKRKAIAILAFVIVISFNDYSAFAITPRPAVSDSVSIPVGDAPIGVTVNTITNRIYVTNMEDNTV